MSKDRRSRHGWRNKNSNKNTSEHNNHPNNHSNNVVSSKQRSYQNLNHQGMYIDPAKKFVPSKNVLVTSQQIAEENNAIKKFKSSNQLECPYCKQVIQDLGSALTDRMSDKPVHFDCALNEVSKTEKLEPGDKIAYIGQGRFGVINYPNVHDVKHFTIKKIIEWENQETRAGWRDTISDLFSLVR